jgi:hypothetical protein
MNPEMQTAIDRLEGLPEDAQQILALKFNAYLNKLRDLQNTIQASRNSGTSEVFSKEKLLARIHQRHVNQLNG